MGRRVAVLIALFLTAAIGWWFYGELFTLDSIVERESHFREYVKYHPVRAPLLGFLVYIVLSLVPGTTGKAMIFGWLFGFWVALVITSTALTIAAMISFLVVRYVFRNLAEAKLSAIIHYLDRAVLRDGAKYLIALRLLHAPYTLMNYASGATAIPVTTFGWTTHLGMLPGIIVFVLAGSKLPTIRLIAENGLLSFVDLNLLLLLSILAFLPFLVRSLRRRFPRNRGSLEHNSLKAS